MAKKVQLMKKVNNTVETMYPRTSADNVLMSTGTATVEDKISTLTSDLSTLTSNFNALLDKLDLDEVYAKNSSGILLEDDDGTNLIAVH